MSEITREYIEANQLSLIEFMAVVDHMLDSNSRTIVCEWPTGSEVTLSQGALDQSDVLRIAPEMNYSEAEMVAHSANLGFMAISQHHMSLLSVQAGIDAELTAKASGRNDILLEKVEVGDRRHSMLGLGDIMEDEVAVSLSKTMLSGSAHVSPRSNITASLDDTFIREDLAVTIIGDDIAGVRHNLAFSNDLDIEGLELLDTEATFDAVRLFRQMDKFERKVAELLFLTKYSDELDPILLERIITQCARRSNTINANNVPTGETFELPDIDKFKHLIRILAL